MDMREMVDKVKRGEPLYGKSSLTPYMQGVAARNSRYSALMAHVIPWVNFVNHNQVSLVWSGDRLWEKRGLILVHESTVSTRQNTISKQSVNWRASGCSRGRLETRVGRASGGLHFEILAEGIQHFTRWDTAYQGRVPGYTVSTCFRRWNDV